MAPFIHQPEQHRGFHAALRRLILTFLLAALPAGSWAQSPKMARIGVIANASIAVSDASQRGFEAALAGAGFREGVNVAYDRQNTGGDPQKTQAIARRFEDHKLDLIHSFGTSATLAVMKASPRIPIVFSAVTDPVGAGIVPVHSAAGQPSGTNVTGISDRWPVRLQMEAYTRILPRAKKWGTIYNPAEANSVSAIRSLRESARTLGLELVEVHVAGPHEVRPAITSLVGRVQAVYLPADNTVGAEFSTITEVAQKSSLAFFSGDSTSVSRGGLAAFGVDYFLVGYAAGKKAAQILQGAAPGDTPWNPASHFSLIVNQKAARALGIVIPAEMVRIADRVIE